MAHRKRKRQNVPDYKFEMNMTPMIDVVFQLMIFFMCTIKFKTLEGKLSAYLPKDVGVNSSDAEPIEKVDIQIKVIEEGAKLHPLENTPWTGTGPYKFGPGRKMMFKVGAKSITSVKELQRRLEELHDADPERAATIDAFPGTVYEDMVHVLDVAVKAGFNDITFKGARKPTK